VFLSEAIRDYGEWARHEAGYTKSTQHAYLSWLRNWARWLEEQGYGDPQAGTITVDMVRRYQYAMSARGCRPRTIRGALAGVRALLGWLHEQGAIPSNPAEGVRMPKKDAATRLLVDDDTLVKLLEAAGRQADDFRAVRDTAVLAVLIFCGLRRQELLDLQVPHVNLEDRALLVQQGKGKKSRLVPLCPEACAALQSWLAWRRANGVKHQWCWTDWGKRRMGELSLRGLLEEVKAIAGFKGDPRILPHSIRHAAATRLLRNGADIRSIQAWLGHAHLTTTAVYLHTDENQVRKIADLAGLKPMPREELTREETTRRSRTELFRRQRLGR
jgi:site-specific recombinase XerD